MKALKQQDGIKQIRKHYSDKPGTELSEEDGYLTIKVYRKLLMGKKENASWFKRTNYFLKKVFEVYGLPFNTIELEEYVAYNLDVKEV